MSYIAPLIIGLLGLALLMSVLSRLWQRRWLSATGRLLSGGLMVSLAGLMGLVFASTYGYQQLTNEQLAATLKLTPIQPQIFEVTVTYPDGHHEEYLLAGDQVYVDARIIKWHPWLNVMGLKTAFELDRIAGRYHRLDDEKQLPRTVYALGKPKMINLFQWHDDMPKLASLVDAQYGSATYLDVKKASTLDVLVSTSGLLIRPHQERN